MKLTIPSNARVALIGRTGSGKTYLAKKLLSKVSRLVVFDGKGTLTRSFHTVKWSTKTEKSLIFGEPIRLRIPPVIAEEPDIAKIYDEYFAAIYEAGNCTVYIDEVYAILPNNRMTPFFRAIYTRGRELGISVYASSQRPAWIPRFILSESEVFFIFQLQLKDDLKRLAEIVGEKALDKIPDKHGFYIYDLDSDQIMRSKGLTK